MKIWRAVTASSLHAGRGSILGPATSRRTCWWELTLECSHRTERTVRYRTLDPPQTQGTRRLPGDALPPPARVVCPECTVPVINDIT